MTAKEQLRERIEAFTEDEADEALRLLDLRTDPIIAAFRDAPCDDEPWTTRPPRPRAAPTSPPGAPCRSSRRSLSSTSDHRVLAC